MIAKNMKVCGVGVNDADFPIKPKGKLVRSYRVWSHVLNRCYSSKYHKIQPTYIDCYVEEVWHKYSNFHLWFMDQEPPEQWAIDKDILSQGNKIYSPSFCVMVPRELNNFTNEHAATRGDLPIGVCYNKKTKYFEAWCNEVNSRKQKFLGSFRSPEAAHSEYRSFKWEQAKVWIDRIQSDSRYKRKDDLCKGLETRYKI